MRSSFLLTHSVNDFLFDLGSNFSPVSIKDQMIRGFLVADHLLAENLIGPKLPLIVVGAGAAGATTALVAASRDVPTTLVDKEEQPFSRQLYCPTRFLSPTDYDWPAEHWTEQRFPWSGVLFPFGWRAKYAALAAGSWRAKLFRTARTNPNLHLRPAWKIRNPSALVRVAPDANNLVTVGFEDWEGNIEVSAAAVVVACTGPGKERCTVRDLSYSGLQFWEPDTLQEYHFGLRSSEIPRLVVSGGGDGALQDFLRIVTNRASAGEVLTGLPSWVQRQLAATAVMETEFHKTYANDATRFNCRAGHILHRHYSQAIERLFEDCSSDEYDELDTALTEILRWPSESFRFELVHPCSHFSKCYPLNRVLVLLIAEFVNRKYGLRLITPFTTITNVLSEDHHDCVMDFDACRERSHSVQFGLVRCPDIQEPKNATKVNVRQDSFDIVIIRHGLDPTFLFGQPARGGFRELLPASIEVDWH